MARLNEKDFMTLMGKTINTARNKRNMSQRQLAKKLGFRTPQMISNYERGVQIPSPRVVARLSKTLGLNKNAMTSILVENYRAKITKMIN